MWQEELDDDRPFEAPDDVQDLQFSIDCKTLPVDHAQGLSRAVLAALPWFAEEPQAALHLIHVAGSGNGWERPEGAAGVLHPSRRTKLVLRVPKHRLEDASRLSGQVLDVDGNRMVVGDSSARLLSVTNTLYSRHVVVEDPALSEQDFTASVVAELKQAGLAFKKVLCGKTIIFQTDRGPLVTRSLMVADVSFEDAIRLQEQGIGQDSYKKLGCGLFIAHKSV
jgi:CRISPR-associated protein Cas6